MQRSHLLRLLDSYRLRCPDEAPMVDRVRELLGAHPDCFERTCQPGHVTASAWILSADGSHFLLTHHRKLGRWLQLGGHADGDPDVLAVALREAREESGMWHFATPDPMGRTSDGSIVPLDVDVHPIPARGSEPAHEHHDLRFLLVAGPDQTLVRSAESNDLAWLAQGDLARVEPDSSLARLHAKGRIWLASRTRARSGSLRLQ